MIITLWMFYDRGSGNAYSKGRDSSILFLNKVQNNVKKYQTYDIEVENGFADIMKRIYTKRYKNKVWRTQNYYIKSANI